MYNFLGVEEQTFVSGEPFTTGRHVLGLDLTKQGLDEHHETVGQARLWIDNSIVGEGPLKTQIGSFTLRGDGLCVGRDSGDAVTAQYPTPSHFRGGTISQVEISVGDDQYLDLEKEAFAALARE